MAVTVGGLWSDGRALLERHSETVVPIAAAFIFLPQVIRLVLFGPSERATEFTGADFLSTAIVMTLGFVGQMAATAIMLGGSSAPYDVADAIRRAARLLPRALAAVLFLGLCALPLFFLLGVLAAAMVGFGRIGDPQAITQAAGILIIPAIIFFAYFGGRLFLLFPVLVSETPGARETVKRSWRLTKPRQWAFAGFVLSAFLAIAFLSGVINMALSGVLKLMLGPTSPITDLVLVLISTLIGTAVGLISIGGSVSAYRQLGQERA